MAVVADCWVFEARLGCYAVEGVAVGGLVTLFISFVNAVLRRLDLA